MGPIGEWMDAAWMVHAAFLVDCGAPWGFIPRKWVHFQDHFLKLHTAVVHSKKVG
jgi:hypothetical protein